MKKIKNLLAILLSLLLLTTLSGCVEKQMLDGDTPITNTVIKPGTYKDITFNLKVTPLNIPQSDVVAENQVDENKADYDMIETITSIPLGFKVYLLSINNDVLTTPRELNTNDEIFKRDYFSRTPEYYVSYKLRIMNNNHELYESDPQTYPFSELFNKSFILTTYTNFIEKNNSPEQVSAMSIAKMNSETTSELEKSYQASSNPEASITINSGEPGMITPILDGVTLEKDTATAYWGYNNENNFKVTIPREASAISAGTALDSPQPPMIFEPGRVKKLFNPKFTSPTLEWTITPPGLESTKSLATVPSLKLSLTDNKTETKAGEILDYVIKVTNSSEDGLLKDIVLTETVPSGTTFEPTAQNSFTVAGNGTYVAKIDTLKSGETKVLHFFCKVTNSLTSSNIINTIKAEYMTREIMFSLDAEDITAYTVATGSVLPQTGGFIQTKDLLIVGFLFCALGVTIIVLKKSNTANK